MRHRRRKLSRMPGARLALALDQLPSADWQYFERFAAEFLSVEYPSLRTTASPHGDRGRDGQIYIPREDPKVAVQYSLASNWDQKIRATVRRLKETMPSVTQIIYATNQVIGPDADSLLSEMRRNEDRYIDIRDRSWFVDRELTHPQRETASIELARRIVEPLLLEKRLRDNVAPAIVNEDARVGLLHLVLESRDEASNKGLTKTCFDSLTLAALHDTDPESRASRKQVHDRVESFLPAGHETQISQQVDSALQRLSGRAGPVKHYQKADDFCLSFAERERVAQRTSEYLLFEHELEQRLADALALTAPSLKAPTGGWAAISRDLRMALENVLLRRGEAFAESTKTGRVFQIDAPEIIRTVADSSRSTGRLLTDEQVASAVMEVLDKPSPAVRSYLHRLADAYTMFAFLLQTPDVQKAMVTMFSNGELWLDTSAILPVIAENLLEDATSRRYSAILRAAKDAGLRLFVTDGVVEEVERHLNRCLVFSRTPTSQWRSNVPFIYSMYALSGRARASFAGWVENFRGSSRPEEDVLEYLSEAFGVERRNLKEQEEQASIELRSAVQEVWFEAHERRRKSVRDEEVDGLTRHRLVAHDVENTVGVIQLRRGSSPSPLGYRAWLLTLDGVAFSLTDELKKHLGKDSPSSPAISPDFMTQYLRLGPLRAAIERELWVSLPILTDISRYDYLPKELVELADSVREEHGGIEERVLRRRVRDTLETAKVRRGPETLGGMRHMHDRLKETISSQTRDIKD